MSSNEKSPTAAIVSAGMVTAVGLSAKETAANVRAGVSGYRECDWLNRGYAAFVMGEVPKEFFEPLPLEITGQPGFSTRHGRMVSLATGALRDCLGTLQLSESPPLFLALPEHQSTVPLRGESFLKALHTHYGVFDLSRSRAEWQGRAGGLLAIGEAINAVNDGVAECIIAGGVDSFFDPYVLSTLELTERTKCQFYPDSFCPGEAAGFVLISKRDYAARVGISTMTITSVSKALEAGYIGSDKPYKGDGLAQAFTHCLSKMLDTSPIQEVYSSMNGESYWSKEWGVARSRSSAYFAQDTQLHHPAEFLGDVGAAFGPVAMGMAVIGANKGYRKIPVLIYGSSDNGERAACAIAC